MLNNAASLLLLFPHKQRLIFMKSLPLKVLMGFLLLASLSSAQTGWQQFENEVVPVFHDVMCLIYRIIWKIAGPLGVLVLVWAGVKWIYSQDDPAERERAKEFILQVIMALTVIIIARAVAEFILSTDTGGPVVFNCNLV